ncbi:MAG: hypothetical protein AVDCRST_MAG06-2997, partial [uncultured Nocardioides sp.]
VVHLPGAGSLSALGVRRARPLRRPARRRGGRRAPLQGPL